LVFRGTLVRGTLVRGTLVRGTLVRGTLARGTLVRGTLVRGTLVRGTLVRGTLVRGTLVRGKNLVPDMCWSPYCDLSVPLLYTYIHTNVYFDLAFEIEILSHICRYFSYCIKIAGTQTETSQAACTTLPTSIPTSVTRLGEVSSSGKKLSSN
jgi:hypothetical protein